MFKEAFEAIRSRVSRKTKKTFHISYSFQKKETDTLAVTLENQSLRDDDNQLVFRPSGHGALLENLNEVNADIIFIKNIDNVAAREFVDEIATYKRILAGKLLEIQAKIFGYLSDLEGEVSLEKVKEIQSFIWNELDVKELPGGIVAIQQFLNRPIRVCGVVKNTGAPGGGPFWIKDGQGNISLQIIEKSQIDLDDDRQSSIVNESTHFNPVDIVCGLRDYKGNKFDLTKYANPDSGFISNKYEQGQSIRACGMVPWPTGILFLLKYLFKPLIR